MVPATPWHTSPPPTAHVQPDTVFAFQLTKEEEFPTKELGHKAIRKLPVALVLGVPQVQCSGVAPPWLPRASPTLEQLEHFLLQ